MFGMPCSATLNAFVTPCAIVSLPVNVARARFELSLTVKV
jgi:hypothetical protein